MGETPGFFLYSFPSGSPDPIRERVKMLEQKKIPLVVGCLNCSFRTEDENEMKMFDLNGCPICPKEIRSLFIEGRLWFDKINGNTYFSNRVWVNGKVAFVMPFEYGYEMQFLHSALNELVKRAYTNTNTLWELRDEQGIDVYYSGTYGKKSEMFKESN
jgi:hypothetical protein